MPGILALPGSAAAQDQPTPAPVMRKQPEQVLVTARRKEEALIDVPVAVTAVSGAKIEQFNVSDMKGIATLVPNLVITERSAGSYAEIFLRGVGSGGVENGFEQAVVFNVDGVSIARGAVGIQGMFDIDSIEVLKGPQALFFGKNSSAGVIGIRTRGATDTFEAFLSAGYEFKADEMSFEGAVSGPITDYLGFRAAFRVKDQSGFVRNNSQPVISPANKINGGQMRGALPHMRRWGEKEYLGRITLDYDPGTNFDASLKVMGSMLKNDGPTGKDEVVWCGPDDGQPGGGHHQFQSAAAPGLVDPYQDCRLNLQTSVGALPINQDVQDTWRQFRHGGSYGDYWSVFSVLNMNYTTEDWNIASVTGFMRYEVWNGHLSGNSSYSPIPTSLYEGFRQASQELRFSTTFDKPLNFVAGAYYEDSRLGLWRTIIIRNPVQDPVTRKYQDFDSFAYTNGRSVSVFGQAVWDITDRIELAGGARWSQDHKTSRMLMLYVNPAVAAFYRAQGNPLNLNYKDSNVSPEATLTFHATDEFMVYAAYKTGYKAGGHGVGTFPSATLGPVNVSFRAEKSEGFEVGWKLVDPGTGLQLTGAAYHYIFSDLQVSSFDAGTATFNLNNAAKAQTTGVEMEGTWQATDELQLRSNVAYNRARYESFPGAPCYSLQSVAEGCVSGRADLSGKPLKHAPKWQARAGFTYDVPISESLGLAFTGDLAYTSSYFAFAQLAPQSQQKSFVKIDATVRLYDAANDHWEVALIGRNLTNKLTLLNAANSVGGALGEVSGTPSRPREIWIKITGRY